MPRDRLGEKTFKFEKFAVGYSCSIERSISELLIFVKLVLKINNKVLEVRVTSNQYNTCFS